MPELPEVEAAQRAIEEHCLGKKITICSTADDPKVIDGISPSNLKSSLVGKTILAALCKERFHDSKGGIFPSDWGSPAGVGERFHDSKRYIISWPWLMGTWRWSSREAWRRSIRARPAQIQAGEPNFGFGRDCQDRRAWISSSSEATVGWEQQGRLVEVADGGGGVEGRCFHCLPASTIPRRRRCKIFPVSDVG